MGVGWWLDCMAWSLSDTVDFLAASAFDAIGVCYGGSGLLTYLLLLTRCSENRLTEAPTNDRREARLTGALLEER